MPKDKSATRARIMPAAKKEFLDKGFEKASMRSIAASAGMTSAGLYRHFEDKEAMFAALVQPAVDAIKDMADMQTKQAYRYIDEGNLDAMWIGDTDLSRLINIVYEHFDAFRLMLRSSSGTRFEHIFDEFIEMEQAETLRYMDALRGRGIHVNDIVPEELHLLLNAYYSVFFEIVIHEFPKEDALHYLETLKKFFYPGWRAFLGF